MRRLAAVTAAAGQRASGPAKRLAAVAAVAGLLALPGCGLGAGEEREGGATLRVTRDFGHMRLASETLERVREDQTVMRFLHARRKVETSYGGRFVKSIDGLAASSGDGPRDWFYYVNGTWAGEGAAERELSPGDAVQWDFRRWDATSRVSAIVGAYPEPFAHGIGGKRLPTRLECERPDGRACRDVARRLAADGVTASRGALGSPASDELLRVVVARWPVARRVRAVGLIERGPGESGVFARVRDSRLELLDERGRVAQTAPAGSGLVAATSLTDGAIVWVVTGLDDRGVEAAAGALDGRTLAGAFAVAATPSGTLRLPVRERENR